MDQPLKDYAKFLDLLPPVQLIEAERVFRLRRVLPTHTSDVVDAFVVARAFKLSLPQTGAFIAFLHCTLNIDRLEQPSPPNEGDEP